MANYNRIILIGNLTRDTQLSYLPNQTAAVDFGLAVNHRYRDAQGNNKDDVCYVDCRVYGKPAETANQYLAKGKQVLVEGRLVQSRWEAKDGTKQSKHRVHVEKFQFLGAPGGAGGQGPSRQRPPMRQGAPAPSNMEDYSQQGDEGEPPPTGEDIPF